MRLQDAVEIRSGGDDTFCASFVSQNLEKSQAFEININVVRAQLETASSTTV